MRYRKAVLGLLTVVLVISVVMVVEALAAPKLIRHEDTLTDASGNPLPDQTLSIRFRICTANTKGTALWTEVHQVDVKNGAYSVLLGSSKPFPATLFVNTSPRWLEVKVGANPPLPRQQMASVPYALNAETLDALDSIEFSRSTHTHDLSSLTGSVPDAQIPATISRDSELTAGLATKADTAHPHSGTDITTGTVVEARIDPLITRDSELTAGLAAKANTVHTHDDRYYTKAQVDALETRIANLEAMVTQLQSLVQNVSRNGNDITFSGVNVHIVNGSGTTQSKNSLGNLIVGYNETRAPDTDDRSGSHNIVVGQLHNFSSYGGLVAGYGNTVSGAFGSVSGGQINTASGVVASVSGGSDNTASGQVASVSGGHFNTASGDYASVSGGDINTASGFYASVSGGLYNQALGDWSFVGGGGHRNAAFGNKAYANLSAILGGANNVAGIQGAADQGELSSVTGGDTNVASGHFSSVSGGKNNYAAGSIASVSGGSSNTASGNYASVSGGSSNTASSNYASVSGGKDNYATGNYASVSGGKNNYAIGSIASVSGGSSNTASGELASVSGGENNLAIGSTSSVSGGGAVSVTAQDSWAAGSYHYP